MDGPAVATTADMPVPRRGRLRWWGAFVGFAFGIVDTLSLAWLGAAFTMGGRDVTGLVGIWFGSSFALLGFLWYGVWQARVSDDPATHPRIHTAERAFVLANRPQLDGASRVSWSRLLAHRATWAVIIAHFANNWGIYVILNWLPTYFVRELGVDVAAVGLYTVVPWLTMFVTNNAVGWIADALLHRGVWWLPAFLDRASVAFYGDAGTASFDRFLPESGDNVLVSVGMELAANIALQYDVPYLLRLGVGVPVRGREVANADAAEAYVRIGASF